MGGFVDFMGYFMASWAVQEPESVSKMGSNIDHFCADI